MTTAVDTPRLPFEQPDPLLLPPVLRRLREQGTVHKVRTATGDPAWLVTGYEQVKALAGDARLGRSHPDPDSAARLSDSAMFGGRPSGDFDTEPADHVQFRGLLTPFFTAKRMRALEPRVEALVEELLDDMERRPGSADLNAALAHPLPVLVICELLGVPYDDRDEFRAASEAAASTVDAEVSQRGMGELFTYMRELVALKRKQPADDVISGLCAIDGIDDDTVAGLAAALLFAGHVTTVTEIGYATVLLLSDPQQRRLLAEDPARVAGAVEECLRYRGSGSGGLFRYPREDIEVAGVRIGAGELVLLDLGAANHDPEVFDAPDRFDITRPGNAHLAFSHGGYYCIGAALARIELRAAIGALFRRFPGLRLAVPVESLEVRKEALDGGLVTVPVTW
ncbi:cytochrome P450 [Stackebrandtia nassauensis]|uniref:Cytochrome P450 n=1 Tax=Stackebrandtia nassauensis (strain DSM 44728 / CIP 108903 / NRRL B-16338 / NBRC 102104 / LLR-40K-21) TaxID=446470 RepID=D3PUS7_STANL|nr:cytochrome P450 [Stackebrandtia nassauensis]ADD44951.1 cytochrome P450 [Stackebrandtia nassauensis DSM 44728]